MRRDADEQLVLAHVYSRLSNIVSNLTIQVFKDDWTRASTFNIMGNPAFPQNYPYTSSQYGASSLGRGPSPTQDLSYSSPISTSFKPVLMPQQIDQSNFSTGSHSHGEHQYGHGHSHSHGHGHSHGPPKQH